MAYIGYQERKDQYNRFRAQEEVRLRDAKASMRRQLELRDELDRMEEEEEYCMCGSPMKGHSWHDGHTPVSQNDYYNDQQLHAKEQSSMNYSTAIFLVNDDVKAVSVSYDVEADGKTAKGPLITFKTLDKTLKVGDFVVAPTNTRHKMTVVRVEEINVEVDIDTTAQINWLTTGAVDLTAFQAILEAEQQAITKMKEAEKVRRQNEMRAKLIEANPELSALRNVSGDAIRALSAPVETKI